jgi:hypothetical protein
MTTLLLTRDADWRTLLDYLPRDYEQLAREHRQVETQYGNAKITSAQLLLRFILLHVGANLPLRQTVALMAEAGGPSLAPMRLHKKMCRAAPYLQALVARMVDWPSRAQPELWMGYSLVLVDATTVSRPGSVGTDARIHTKLRPSDMSLCEAIVTDGRGGETLKRFTFAPGELVVGDRGYCGPPGIAHAREQGADVLVRLKRGTMPLWQASGGTLDVLPVVRALRSDAVLDLPVYCEHDDERIVGRFIATRLPEAEAAEARQRLRKEYGTKARTIKPETLEAAGYVMLFTTVARERMNAARCLEAYRLRWQIELHFKRWKSLGGFDRLPNFLEETTASWIYAKVLLGLLLDRMNATEFSPPVHLEVIAPRPRRPRRRRAASAGPTALEAHEHALPLDARRASTAVPA